MSSEPPVAASQVDRLASRDLCFGVPACGLLTDAEKDAMIVVLVRQAHHFWQLHVLMAKNMNQMCKALDQPSYVEYIRKMVSFDQDRVPVVLPTISDFLSPEEIERRQAKFG